MSYKLYFFIVITIVILDAMFVNILYLKIKNKAKDSCNKDDFIWNSFKIRENLSEYFDEENGKKYIKLMNWVWIIFFINVLLLLSLPLYQYYFGK